LFTKDRSKKTVIEKALESKFMKMVDSMRASGKMINEMVKALKSTKMETNTTAPT
jgi:hypothetical protein